jgi:uncharacterized protein YabN with tetrapyrrole methylase and pyrophosphatase domain
MSSEHRESPDGQRHRRGDNAGPFTNYLIRLATNPADADLVREGASAAAAQMTNAGLSSAHQEVLRSKDPARIRDAILAERQAREPLSGTPTGTGSLTVVGTGIRAISDVTLQTRGTIAAADKVFSIVADPLTDCWIEQINPTAESLRPLYRAGRPRLDAYSDFVDCVMSYVRRGFRVCFAAYGHPGVLSQAPHAAVQQSRAEGFSAKMLPAISADGWVFANLGVDPGVGHQTLDATDFIFNRRTIDPRCSALIFQVGLIGLFDIKEGEGSWNPKGLPLLADLLLRFFPETHQVTLYEAAVYPVCESRIETVALANLRDMPVALATSLYVPPVAGAAG